MQSSMGKSVKTEYIHVPYLEVDQDDYHLYCFVMNSKDLREIAYVSKREPTGNKGYQRHFSQKRLRDVGEYISKPKATFPNSIVAYLNPDAVSISPNSLNPKFGEISIRRQEHVAWIIDGQHRLFGFEFSQGKELDLIVAGYIGLSIPDQASIFRIINSEQKGVSPSLIFDLIDLTKDAEFYDTRAHEIVKALNEDVNSPWYSQIKMLGTGKGIISQSAFITELRKALKNPLVLKDYEYIEQVKILKNFFGALKELFPEAWGNQKYVLCKTLGVAASFSMLGKVLIYCKTTTNSLTQDEMKKVLKGLTNIQIPTREGMEKLDFSGRQLGGYGGKQGQVNLSEMFENALPKLKAKL
jgi:DGQHR domain-containing protein